MSTHPSSLRMITFRTHDRRDIPLRVKWLNNKNANAYLTDDPIHVTTVEEQEEWFARYEADGSKAFLTICDDETPIGFMGLSRINSTEKSASVFLLIGEDDFRGKGIGGTALAELLTYATQTFGVTTFTLDVNEENTPAVRLYTRAGFVPTGLVDGPMIAMNLHREL